MGLHGTDVHAAVVYVGFVGDFEIFGSLMDPIFGCNLWLIAGKVYDSYFYIFYFMLILRRSFVPGVFLPLRRFPPYSHLLVLNRIYCSRSLIVAYSLLSNYYTSPYEEI